MVSQNVTNVENKFEEHQSKNVVKQIKELEMINDELEDDLLISNYEIFNGKLEVLEHWLNDDDDESSIELVDEQRLSVVSFQESLINGSMNNEQISSELIENMWFDETESFFEFSDNL